MNSSIWGPHGWEFIHSVALGFPIKATAKEQADYRSFFVNIQHVLPCPVCKDHYRENLKVYSIDEAVLHHQTLFNWTVDMHNEVNKVRGKEEWKYDRAFSHYFHKYKTKQQMSNNYILSLLLIVAVFAIINILKHD